MKDLKLFDRILNLKTLKPSKKTNDAFFDLVSFCKDHNNKITLTKKQVCTLRKLSSKAEFEMELYWAHKILQAGNPEKMLAKFWYYKNYEGLVDLEYSNISCLFPKIKDAMFVGGGPLPLTAILLAKKYGLSCTILDNDAISCTTSRQLIETLKLQKLVTVVCGDAKTYKHYRAYSLIYLAALVGHDEKRKRDITFDIYKKMKKGGVLVCRSSHGTRTLLYPKIDASMTKTIKPMLEVRPYNSIINSFFILQKT